MNGVMAMPHSATLYRQREGAFAVIQPPGLNTLLRRVLADQHTAALELTKPPRCLGQPSHSALASVLRGIPPSGCLCLWPLPSTHPPVPADLQAPEAPSAEFTSVCACFPLPRNPQALCSPCDIWWLGLRLSQKRHSPFSPVCVPPSVGLGPAPDRHQRVLLTS